MRVLARRLLPMALLYGGRIGVAGLGLVVLPWLSARMSAEQFGLAATILSLQALAVVLDLGMSVTIAREFPAFASARDRRALMQRSEATLLKIYLALGLVVALVSLTGLFPVPPDTALLVCLSLLLIVWQNFLIVSFVAEQRFLLSTISQFGSLAFRHCCSLVLVILVAGSVQAFVIGQVVGGAVVLAISRYLFARSNRLGYGTPSIRPLKVTSVAIMVYTISSASAMQLDKILLTTLSSASVTGAYFLASMLSLVPITFLATPVSQFVQPKLIGALARGEQVIARRWIIRLTLAIIILAVFPGIILGFAAQWFVPLWLQDAPQQEAVIRYVAILMPGASVGALGLVPAIILISKRDYRAMAIISLALAIIVLGTTALLARRDATQAICVAYALYHALAAAALWWRAWRTGHFSVNSFAIQSEIDNDDAERAGAAPA